MRHADAAEVGRAVVQAGRLTRIIEGQLSDEALKFKYGNFVHGGWRHPQGHWEDRSHDGIIRFHEACKALFCPTCDHCKKHQAACRCVEPRVCWSHIGQAPMDEETVYRCPLHGEIPWRRALFYTTIAALPANQWGKTSCGAAEFFAGIIGRRPWDETLTAPPHSGWTWIIVCQTLQTSGALNIEGRIHEYLGSHIVRARKNSSGGVSFWDVRTPWGIDKLKMVSQDQHKNTKAEVSPLEGAHYHGVWEDEPCNGSLRSAVNRGLKPGKEQGWGKEIITATFFEGTPEARVEVAENVWGKAFVNGGSARQIFAMTGRMADNPANTPEFIRQTSDGFPAHERKARVEGFMEFVTGRVFSEYEPKIHDWDQTRRDVLVTDEGNMKSREERMADPKLWSGLPIYMAVDPADKRPWAMIWVAIDREGEWRVVREWPSGDFHDMQHYRDAGADNTHEFYAKTIRQIEATIPGGERRVVKRIMDKRFAAQEKTGSGGLALKDAMRQQGIYFSTEYSCEGRAEILAGNNVIREKLLGTWEHGQEVDSLHHPHLWVAEDCHNVRWSLLYHVHKDGKTESTREAVSETGKDHVDCLRFLALSKPWYIDWRELGQANVKRSRDTAARAAASRPYA